MSKKFVDRAGEVREGEELDADAIETYLSEHAPELADEVEIEQFAMGHSNLTYLLRVGGKELVLRRPPFGTEVKTAHDMEREFRILSALQGVYPAAPKPLLYCDDVEVIGAPFYIMERVRGVILRGNVLPPELGLGAEQMHALSTTLVDRLVELHAIDIDATGLGSLGKPDGYVERQIKGWTERYFAARTDEIVAMETVATWLNDNIRPEAGASLIHGDFKYDNFVLDPGDLGRVIAVLDWEMATVGDPLMDLGTTLAYWVDRADPGQTKMLPLLPTTEPGNLDRREIVERYQEVSGRQIEDPLFYYVYGLFKVAVIAQQIYKRFAAGLTKDPRFGMMIMGVNILSQQAVRALEQERIHDLG